MNNNMNQEELRKLITKVVRESIEEAGTGEAPSDGHLIPVEMSARHVHLTQQDVEVLFGKGATLTLKKNLTLPGFLCEERVNIVTRKGSFTNVAIIGPVRDHNQVELSATDAFQLGIKCPCNISGDFTDAADVYLVGTHGMICARESAIISQAHVHLSPEEGKKWGIKDREIIEVEVLGSRPLVMKNVMARIGEGMHAMMHIDMDEFNASGNQIAKQAIIKK